MDYYNNECFIKQTELLNQLIEESIENDPKNREFYNILGNAFQNDYSKIQDTK